MKAIPTYSRAVRAIMKSLEEIDDGIFRIMQKILKANQTINAYP